MFLLCLGVHGAEAGARDAPHLRSRGSAALAEARLEQQVFRSGCRPGCFGRIRSY